MEVEFKWAAYLTLAEQQFRQATDKTLQPLERQALLRAAISRTYYAAFVSARNYLRHFDRDEAIPFAGIVHSYVANKFRNHNDGRRRLVGRTLKRLRGYRNAADYDDVFADDLLTVTRQVIADAKQVIEILAGL